MEMLRWLFCYRKGKCIEGNSEPVGPWSIIPGELVPCKLTLCSAAGFLCAMPCANNYCRQEEEDKWMNGWFMKDPWMEGWMKDSPDGC